MQSTHDEPRGTLNWRPLQPRFELCTRILPNGVIIAVTARCLSPRGQAAFLKLTWALRVTLVQLCSISLATLFNFRLLSFLWGRDARVRIVGISGSFSVLIFASGKFSVLIT